MNAILTHRTFFPQSRQKSVWPVGKPRSHLSNALFGRVGSVFDLPPINPGRSQLHASLSLPKIGSSFPIQLQV